MMKSEPRRRRTGYKRHHAIRGELDPARAIICNVLYRAVLDWKAARRGVRACEEFWPLDEWRELGISDPVSELLAFFGSPEFRGMCEWVDLEPDVVLEALGVPADLHVV